MKHQITLFLIFILLLVVSCGEEPIGQIPIDNVAPGKVSDVKVKNVKGGAILTYKLPNKMRISYM